MNRSEHAGPEEETRHVRFKEILIVDQDETWALVMRDAVAGGGFAVALATTIEEAVRKVRDKSPDLLLVSCLLDPESTHSLRQEIDSLKVPLPVVLVGLRPEDHRWDFWKDRRYVSAVRQPFKSRELLDVALALLGTTWEDLTGESGK